MGRKGSKSTGEDFRAFIGASGKPPKPTAGSVPRYRCVPANDEWSGAAEESSTNPRAREDFGETETGESNYGAETESENNQSRGTTRRRRATQFGSLILDEIGNRFADLRESGGRAEAWATFQSKIMRNLGTLVPDIAQLSSCVSIALEIENFLKSEIATARSASDLFSDWLRTDDGQKPQ